MKFRHEVKHEINYSDMTALRMRLSHIMQTDSHSQNGIYRSRTLYFDTPSDKALREKADGTDPREKFRIRYYNGDTSFIMLERKYRVNSLCNKVAARLTPEEVEKILSGDILWMRESERELLRLLHFRMQTELLSPKTVVQYTREAFVYPFGNVRVTLDYGIRTGHDIRRFLSPDLVTVPAGDSVNILEVKWDEYLPDIIKNAVSLDGRHCTSFSKYEICRIYG